MSARDEQLRALVAGWRREAGEDRDVESRTLRQVCDVLAALLDAPEQSRDAEAEPPHRAAWSGNWDDEAEREAWVVAPLAFAAPAPEQNAEREACIDPNDRAQVDRLEALIREANGWNRLHQERRTKALQTALRNFANLPAPSAETVTSEALTDETLRDALTLGLWDAGIVRPEEVGRQAVDFILDDLHEQGYRREVKP